MNTTTLCDGWTLEAVRATAGLTPAIGTLAAAVPGCVHTDLMAAGVIPDPYLDAAEAEVEWLFDLDWRYRTVLGADGDLDLSQAAAEERVELVFDGIDTVATVRLGEVELGRSVNMHRSYRYDITDALTGGPLELTVDIESATRYAEAERARLGDRPNPYGTPYNFVRKMAASFGWDWGPDLRTAGLWKPVRLQRWSVARLDRVRPLVSVADGVGRVEIHVDLARAAAAEIVLAATVLDQRVEATVPAGESSATLTLEVADPPIWWPIGYGDQPLFDLTVTAAAGDVELDRWSRRIGFRTVQLDTSADEIGTRFTFVINGQPMFVKGVNWIPDDHIVTRVSADRVGRRLDQALAANVNLIRVWGGGIFESDDFYDACDERGLLVWQDFLLACAAYPEHAPLWSEIEAEARENVVRLMSHPSLVHYNGGNENLVGHEEWGWKDRLGELTWGGRYALEMFPAILAELDPTRPYSANSPYSPGVEIDRLSPNHPDHGTEHQWEVWNRIDYRHYRDEIPRFCSEFGFQAPPTWRTLSDWVRAADGRPLIETDDPKSDPNFMRHQKAEDGNGKLDRGMAPHLGVPTDFEDWHWAAQLNQAHAVAHAIDHYRRWWPRTAGAIVWQLNDCWPVTSWAAIDYEERPKPLWYALRAAFAPRRLAFHSEQDKITITVINDTGRPWNGPLSLRRETFDGRPLARAELPVQVAARSVVTVVLDSGLTVPGDPSAEIVVADLDDVSAVHTFVADVDLALDPEPVDVDVERLVDGCRVTVTARAFAKDLTLWVDRIDGDARVDQALVTLPAGRTATFRVHSSAPGLAEQLTAALVLRSSNDLPRKVAVR